MIITGGTDRFVKIWEPYVTSRPTNILRGHNSAIAFLQVDEKDDTLISIDKNRSSILISLFFLFLFKLSFSNLNY